MLKKKCQVVMLSTEKASPIFEIDNELIITYKVDVKSDNNKHIYILSVDIPKKDEYSLDKIHNTIYQVIPNFGTGLKVIATTDTDLIENGVAKIPQAFIEKYISEHNKGNVISEVLVEYEKEHPLIGIVLHLDELIPKLRPDNTVIIHKVKNTFTRNEMEQNLMYCVSSVAAELGLTPTSEKMKLFNEATHKWIEENL